MKTKWYFGVLIATFALFAVNQQELVAPNQEIVLEFTNTNVTSLQAQKAIARVKNRLRSIGVHNTQVLEGEEGLFKIIYYSKIKVNAIKAILSNSSIYENYASHNKHSELPLKNRTTHYELKIKEILNESGGLLGLNGKHMLHPKQEFDRFSNPNVLKYFILKDIASIGNKNKTDHQINVGVVLAYGRSSLTFPEVRAGPLT